jgi:hypothetical protein
MKSRIAVMKRICCVAIVLQLLACVSLYLYRLSDPVYQGKRISQWEAEALSEDHTIKQNAFQVLLTGIKDKNCPEHSHCVAALSHAARKVPGLSPEAVPTLADCLDDSDSKIRFCAVVALYSLRAKAKDAAPALRRLVKEGREIDEKSGIIDAARRILSHIDLQDDARTP